MKKSGEVMRQEDKNTGEPIRWWERTLVRKGFTIVRLPPKDWAKEFPDDLLMVLHHCSVCNVIRFDRGYNLESHEEGVFCGKCGSFKNLRHAHGLTTTRLLGIIKNMPSWSAKFGYLTLLPGLCVGVRRHEKNMPQDRGGKSFGETEMDSNLKVIASLMAYFETQGK